MSILFPDLKYTEYECVFAYTQHEVEHTHTLALCVRAFPETRLAVEDDENTAAKTTKTVFVFGFSDFRRVAHQHIYMQQSIAKRIHARRLLPRKTQQYACFVRVCATVVI